MTPLIPQSRSFLEYCIHIRNKHQYNTELSRIYYVQTSLIKSQAYVCRYISLLRIFNYITPIRQLRSSTNNKTIHTVLLSESTKTEFSFSMFFLCSDFGICCSLMLFSLYRPNPKLIFTCLVVGIFLVTTLV